MTDPKTLSEWLERVGIQVEASVEELTAEERLARTEQSLQYFRGKNDWYTQFIQALPSTFQLVEIQLGLDRYDVHDAFKQAIDLVMEQMTVPGGLGKLEQEYRERYAATD